MKTSKTILKYRRQREGITDYHKRLNLLKSGKTRLVVRRTLNHIIVQFVDFEDKGDKIILGQNSRELEKFGWKFKKNNIPSAYLTGLLAGTKAKDKVKEAVVDLGRNNSTVGSRLYAAIKGVIDAGINVNISEDVLPDEKRLKGQHIEDHKKNNMTKTFEDVKKKIQK